MVNLYTLEKEHLTHLLSKAFKREVALEEINLVSDVGMNKLVFSVPYQNKEVIATALPRDQSLDLHREYSLLKQLYQGAPKIFPKPVFYFETDDQEVFGMELLPHSPLSQLKKTITQTQEARLAEQIGYALGFTYAATGLFTEQPHDDNILAAPKHGTFEVKLIDAEHFLSGTKEDLLDIVLKTYAEDRKECVNHKREFFEGLNKGYASGKR